MSIVIQRLQFVALFHGIENDATRGLQNRTTTHTAGNT